MAKLLLIAALSALLTISSASVKTDSLDGHNKYRADVGLANLVWSSSLADQAQAWAETLAKNDAISHSTGRDNVGESLAYGSSRSNTVTSFVDAWAEEKEDFIEDEIYPACTATGDIEDVKHYTQMVWEETEQLGCGLATNADSGKMYYVCQYYPAGNINGQPPYLLDEEPAPQQPEDPTVPEPQPTEPEQPQEPQQPADPVSSDPFIAESLAAHNNERLKYGVPALKWSTSLANSAKAYSAVQARTGTTSHSTGRVNVGENLAWGSGKGTDVNFLAGMWLAERKYFIRGRDFPNCSTSGSWHDVAHYTTLMWRKTTEVGCGLTKSSSGMNYYVCHYSPRGNMNGEPVF
jgi:uncharacterized protein YkwD